VSAPAAGGLRVGIDVGGTCTDIILVQPPADAPSRARAVRRLPGRAPGEASVNGAPLREAVMTPRPGDRAVLRTPGGGGYGPPRERDPRLVANDTRQGHVSAAAAREDDGVGGAEAGPGPVPGEAVGGPR
jgi:hypothetical protein